MKKIFILFLSIGTMFLLGLQGCSEKPIDGPNNKSLDNMKLGSGMVRSTFQANTTPIMLSQNTSTSVDSILNGIEGVFIKRTRIYEAGLAYDQHLLFNPLNSYLYPGHVFVGNTISTGEYLPVKNQITNKIKIAPDFTPVRPSVDFVKEYDQVSYTAYQQTLQQWRSQDVRTPAASSTFSVEEITNQTELGVKANFNASFQGGSVGANLDFKYSKKKSHVLAKLVQKLFSIGMDIPKAGILKNVNPKDLHGTMPVYISDIYYGRLVYAMFASNSEVTDLKAAITASVNGNGGGLNTRYNKIMENVDVQAVLIGGDATVHSQALNKWPDLKKALARPMELSTAAPISFSMRYADDNSAAKTHHTDKYPVMHSQFVPKCSKIKFSIRTSHILGATPHNKKDVRMYGKATISVPGGETKTLFERAKDHFIVTKSGDNFLYIGDAMPKVTFEIDVPANTKMKDFLENTKVKIHTELTHSVIGSIKKSLGESDQEIALEDLIFFAKDGSLTVGTRASNIREFRGALRYEVGYECIK